MRKRILILILLFSLLGAYLLYARDEPKPKLSLDGSPRSGFAPLNVVFHATLKNVAEDNLDYYCLQEEWDFGFGSKSTEQPNCEPYTAGSKIKSDFIVEHEFSSGGSYPVRLTLGKKKIISSKITVSILEKEIQ